MASVFDSYAPYKGDLSRRNTGSLVSFETGESVGYGLFNAQERGALFIGPGVPVYEGMIVGVSPKQEDITVNVCKKKQMTNMRAAGSDEALRLVPPRKMSLEQCLEFLADDELLEVTPKSLRMRKTILNHEKRMKATAAKRTESGKQQGSLRHPPQAVLLRFCGGAVRTSQGPPSQKVQGALRRIRKKGACPSDRLPFFAFIRAYPRGEGTNKKFRSA